MRLLILSMPAVAFVAILSVSLQHSMATIGSTQTQDALPEATRIYQRYIAKRTQLMAANRPTPLAQPPASPWNLKTTNSIP